MAVSTGVLLLHGWTSSAANFRELTPQLQALGLPWRAPTYSGHGLADASALKATRWQDWLNNGRTALDDLLQEAAQVMLVGHSMGGMLAIQLAAQYPQRIAGVVIAGTSCRLSSPFAPGRPLAFMTPLLALFMRNIKFTPVYTDKTQASQHPGYTHVPSAAVLQLFECVKATRLALPAVHVPLLVLHPRHDKLASPAGVYEILETVATPEAEKELRWFEKTEHELFLDCEREAVNEAVLEFIRACRDKPRI